MSAIRAHDTIGGEYTFVFAQYGIPEYWIVDPALGALERYELNGEAYLLSEIFTAEMTVQSNHISCVSFTMGDILSRVPDLSN
ncbi:hypothetical protein B1748_00570 [Paenibacillus sp. MY03]|uniref:Uma2 family endonuclease n=1 Tax=Paenibacillus sp. MY03 TaxID=302980 RepID=UPI000B3C42A7|nr:Uma2 family endonuclease [Paenibacillus sp. MY03]OUS78603.1 hypothetical protein B1748_00570 [Paenibacillus sp. MY03]